MSDFDVIDPAPTGAAFRGKTIEIKPLTVRQLPAFARAIKPISAVVEGFATGRAELNLGALVGVIADHGDSVVEAVSVATGLSADELGASTPDQLIELAIAVVKVNADFFKGRLTPAILAAVSKGRAVIGAGPTP